MCVLLKLLFLSLNVFGNICLGVDMVKYLECPVSSPSPFPSSYTDYYLCLALDTPVF
jgi:hypothetical protein